jgi:hypothetical protein
MKAFISWSGNRSKYVADVLRGWIPKVLQAVKPWMSEEDISMGARWSYEIAGKLEECEVGIICLTPENQHNPWLMFEAGALSKKILHTYVCPYLIEMNRSQLTGPMAQFQAALADKEGTSRILQTFNKALGDSQIPAIELDEIFDVWWPKLEGQLQNLPSVESKVVQQRTTGEILEEILSNTRENLRREEMRLLSSQRQETAVEALINKIEHTFAGFERFTKDIQNMGESLLGKQGPDGERSLEMVSRLGSPELKDLLQGLKIFSEEQRSSTQRLLNEEQESSPSQKDDGE